MNNPNPNYARPARDPFDEPDVDYKAYMERVFEAIQPNDPVLLRRTELRHWAESAGFENVELCHLGKRDFWEMRFKRGTNAECTNPAEVERWLGFVARGCGCRFILGQFIAIVDGDSIAARFRLRPQPV
jgi:hypothetical protein